MQEGGKWIPLRIFWGSPCLQLPFSPHWSLLPGPALRVSCHHCLITWLLRPLLAQCPVPSLQKTQMEHDLQAPSVGQRYGPQLTRTAPCDMGAQELPFPLKRKQVKRRELKHSSQGLKAGHRADPQGPWTCLATMTFIYGYLLHSSSNRILNLLFKKLTSKTGIYGVTFTFQYMYTFWNG